MTETDSEGNNGEIGNDSYVHVIFMLFMYHAAPVRIGDKRYKYSIDGEIIPYYK